MTNQDISTGKGGPYELARPFIGTWQEYTVKGQEELLEGTLETRIELEGYVLTQRFLSVDGTFSFFAFGYVEPKTNSWYETYVFNNGRVTHWLWHKEEDEIIMDWVNDGSEARRRLRVVNMREESYEVIEERMTEEGKGWDFVVLTRTRRIG
jgi:hypothetical protein